MSAILAENKLHSYIWRRVGSERATITADKTEQVGFGFKNCCDNSGGTKWMLPSDGQQQEITIVFPAVQFTNGFAIYGHNLGATQGISIQTSQTELSTLFNFLDSEEDVYSGSYFPTEKGKAFAAYFPNALDITEFIRLRITTLNWDQNSYISFMSFGMWVDDKIDIAAPFTPPYQRRYENELSRNSNGHPLMNVTRQAATKMTINLVDYEELGLTTQLGTNYASRINGADNGNPTFIDYMQYHLGINPFFLMYDVGADSTETSLQIQTRRSRVFLCHADKSIGQPRYNRPTALEWRLPVVANA